jgi:Ca2+-binding RTX toxin-like protein
LAADFDQYATFAFNNAEISLADISITAGADTLFAIAGGESFTFTGLTIDKLVKMTFKSGSKLLVGDLSNTGTKDNAANKISGSSGDDQLCGLGGDDTLFGKDGDDKLFGGDGNDILDGGDGDDVLDGGTGTDTVSYASVKAPVVVTVNTTSNTGGAGVDVLSGIENLVGTAFNDSLTGDTAANVLNGGKGSDVLTGLAGNDTYYVDSADIVVETDTANLLTVDTTMKDAMQAAVDASVSNANGGPGGTTVASAIASLGGDISAAILAAGGDVVHTLVDYTLAANIETLVLDKSTKNGTGNSESNALIGNAGGNTLDGAGGADIMVGFKGADTYIVDNEGDLVIEATTTNPAKLATVATAGGKDTVIVTTISSYTLPDSVEILKLGNAVLDGTGNAINNTIIGNKANNAINGAAGDDVMIGRRGDDTYTVDSAKDKVVEKAGQGNDTILASVDLDTAVTTSEIGINKIGNEVKSLSVVLPANVEDITLTAGSAALYAVGNDFANHIIGNASDNILKAGTTIKGTVNVDATTKQVTSIIGLIDTLDGGAGDDVLIIDNTNDIVIGGAGNDTVRSYATFSLTSSDGVENLELIGSLATSATGNSGANTIYGNKAANVINGGGGADTLYGWAPIANGAAAVDTFKFSTAAEANGDTIKAFDANDKIDLSDASTGTFSFIDTPLADAAAGAALANNQVGYVFTPAVAAVGTTPATPAIADVYGQAAGVDFHITVELSGITSLVTADFIL